MNMGYISYHILPSIFYHFIPLIRFFFHLPRLQRWSILFQPLSLKFTNSFLLLKQCPLDSIPTFFLKLCFNELGPIITNLVNLSLSEKIFPSSFKQAPVQPLLKMFVSFRMHSKSFSFHPIFDSPYHHSSTSRLFVTCRCVLMRKN